MTEDWREKLRSLSLPEAMEPETPPVETGGLKRHKGKIIISFERKGRGGKQATILSGFLCDDDELLETAAVLKKRLGCGGSARGGEILIQGDRREDVRRVLKELGFSTN